MMGMVLYLVSFKKHMYGYKTVWEYNKYGISMSSSWSNHSFESDTCSDKLLISKVSAAEFMQFSQ